MGSSILSIHHENFTTIGGTNTAYTRYSKYRSQNGGRNKMLALDHRAYRYDQI